MSHHLQPIAQSIGNVTLGDGSTGNIGIFNHHYAVENQQNTGNFYHYAVERQQTAQQALSFPEMYNRLHEISEATPGTCSWILENSDFRRWQEARRALIWIKGKPGAGKSTVMKYMWSHLAQETNSNTRTTASFFCHGRGVNLQKTPSGVFRALLHQIVQQIPLLQKDFEERFRARCKAQGPHGSAWDWTESELRSFTQDYLLKTCRDSELLVSVDALDECGEDSARELLGFFQDVVAASEAQSDCRLKVCVSSRHYPLVRSDVLYEVVVDRENLADIRTYVAQKLEMFRNSTPRHEELLSTIVSGAEETFQWGVVVVARVIRSLESGKPVQLILQDLGQTPQELFQLYRQTIRSHMDNTDVSPQDRKRFFDLFRWLALAKRPLSVLELRSALWIDYPNQDVWKSHNDSLGADIEHLSCGLAEVFRPKDPRYGRFVVGFIHQSVQEYFVSGRGIQELGDSGPEATVSHTAELDIVRTCYKSVLLSKPQADAHTRYPLLHYALNHMFDHARSAEKGRPVQRDLVEILNFPGDDFMSIAKFDHLPESSIYRQNHNLLHIAAYFDIPNLISSVLDLVPEMSINIRAQFGKTALHIAAENGSCNALNRLLDIGQTSTMMSSIFWRRSQLRVLELNARDDHGETPLMYAAQKGHSSIVERLTQTRKADLTMEGRRRHTALHMAIQHEHVDIAKVLIDLGANPCAKDQHGQTPLSLTLDKALLADETEGKVYFALFWSMLAQHRQELYSRQELNMGRGIANVDTYRIVGLRDCVSMLHYGLASRRSFEFAQGLLEKGFDPHAPDRHGRVWFLYLDYKSNPETLYLLQALPGADINFKDISGRTVLARLASSDKANCLMTKHLLKNPQIDVRTRDNHGMTPLMIAAGEGAVEVVNILLADGRSDPQATDNRSLDALYYAKTRRSVARRAAARRAVAQRYDEQTAATPQTEDDEFEHHVYDPEEAEAIVTLLESS